MSHEVNICSIISSLSGLRNLFKNKIFEKMMSIGYGEPKHTSTLQLLRGAASSMLGCIYISWGKKFYFCIKSRYSTSAIINSVNFSDVIAMRKTDSQDMDRILEARAHDMLPEFKDLSSRLMDYLKVIFPLTICCRASL